MRILKKLGVEISGSVIVTISLFVASVLNYFTQVLLGRVLTVSEYGEFSALLALAYIFFIPTHALNTSVIKLSSELKAKNAFSTLTHLFLRVVSWVLLFGFVIFIGLILLRGVVGNYLHLNDSTIVIYFSLFLILSFLSGIPASLLQGLLRFKAFSFMSVISSFVKLVVVLAFVALGFGVKGAFLGMAWASLVYFLLSLLFLKKNFSLHRSEDLSSHYRKFYEIGVSALFIGVGLTLTNNIDIVLVKHFFTPSEAGNYGALVTVGKVLLFGAGHVGVVMFPQISEAFINGADYIRKFYKFLYFQVFLIISGIVVFNLFPSLIVSLLFGKRFLPIASFLPSFSIFVGLYVMASFLILFFLAVNKTKIFLFQIPFVLLQFVLIYLYHNSLGQVIGVNILISGLLVSALTIYYIAYARVDSGTRLQERKNNP